MKTIAYHTIDKSGWPEGPWKDEPDKLQFVDEETGLPCLIVRAGSLGQLCGYVGVPKTHRDYGKGYDDIDIDIHGGLTFANTCRTEHPEDEGICHVVKPGEDDDIWWLGFDCAHVGDLIPSHRAVSYYDTYRDFNYVKSECKNLARQLAKRGDNETVPAKAESEIHRHKDAVGDRAPGEDQPQ